MKFKLLFWTLFTLQSLLLLFLLCQSATWKWKSRVALPASQRQELVQLAKEALKTRDVPVSALLLYEDKIIGRGYNTVLRDSNAGGHAEINALSDAIRHMGVEHFDQLNRDSLLLITTFEPCMMCRGAIIENRIKHVEFIQQKELSHWIKNTFKSLRYELIKKKSSESSLQDSLFRLHPGYPGNNAGH